MEEPPLTAFEPVVVEGPPSSAVPVPVSVRKRAVTPTGVVVVAVMAWACALPPLLFGLGALTFMPARAIPGALLALASGVGLLLLGGALVQMRPWARTVAIGLSIAGLAYAAFGVLALQVTSAGAALALLWVLVYLVSRGAVFAPRPREAPAQS